MVTDGWGNSVSVGDVLRDLNRRVRAETADLNDVCARQWPQVHGGETCRKEASGRCQRGRGQ